MGHPSTRARWSACAVAFASTGCSLVLDWDVKVDAGLDPAACMFKEPNDTIDTAMDLLTTEPGPAAICVPGDHDFYRFNVPADLQQVTIVVTFDIATSQDLDLQLYDPLTPGMPISQGVTFGTNEERIVCPGTGPDCPQLITGNYILEVLGASPATTNLYNISITIAPP